MNTKNEKPLNHKKDKIDRVNMKILEKHYLII